MTGWRRAARVRCKVIGCISADQRVNDKPRCEDDPGPTQRGAGFLFIWMMRDFRRLEWFNGYFIAVENINPRTVNVRLRRDTEGCVKNIGGSKHGGQHSTWAPVSIGKVLPSDKKTLCLPVETQASALHGRAVWRGTSRGTETSMSKGLAGSSSRDGSSNVHLLAVPPNGTGTDWDLITGDPIMGGISGCFEPRRAGEEVLRGKTSPLQDVSRFCSEESCFSLEMFCLDKEKLKWPDSVSYTNTSPASLTLALRVCYGCSGFWRDPTSALSGSLYLCLHGPSGLLGGLAPWGVCCS